MTTDSAIENARPKSIRNAGTGRKNAHKISTIRLAKATSDPPSRVSELFKGDVAFNKGMSRRLSARARGPEARYFGKPVSMRPYTFSVKTWNLLPM